MAAKISRRKLAEYVAAELVSKNKDVLRSLAAYLIDTRREREAELIIRDVAAALERQGVVLVEAVSATKLTADITRHIQSLVQKQAPDASVHIDEKIDSSVIGGIKVTTPTSSYDSTVRHNINALRALKQ